MLGQVMARLGLFEMNKIQAYIKFRKLGMSKLTALDLASNMELTIVDTILAILCVVSLCLVFYSEPSLAYQDDKLNALKNSLKAQKYEQVILSCLNTHIVVINGRSMSCVIKDFKDAQ